jgi:hypothetical protein
MTFQILFSPLERFKAARALGKFLMPVAALHTLEVVVAIADRDEDVR